jgi:hypothetical protein
MQATDSLGTPIAVGDVLRSREAVGSLADVVIDSISRDSGTMTVFLRWIFPQGHGQQTFAIWASQLNRTRWVKVQPLPCSTCGGPVPPTPQDPASVSARESALMAGWVPVCDKCRRMEEEND